MVNFVKDVHELTTELDKWLYALKHLVEFKVRPDYLDGPEFVQLFNLARYANLTQEDREMYNSSLKYKWDNKNVRDYEVEQGREEGHRAGEAIATKRERAKAMQEKINMILKMKANGMSSTVIAELTNFPIQEIEAL